MFSQLLPLAGMKRHISKLKHLDALEQVDLPLPGD
jgi:hypothetical protein